MKLDQFAAIGLIKVRNLDDFGGLRKWLMEWSREEQLRCVSAPASLVQVSQGRAQVLLELLSEIDNAPQTAAKLSGRQ